MNITVFFINRVLFNEVVGRLNIRQYNIGEANYAHNKTGLLCVFDGYATIDDLLQNLRSADYVTKLLNRNPASYDTKPITITIGIGPNKKEMSVPLIYTNI